MRFALSGDRRGAATARPLRLLIVDDSAVTRAALAAMFDREPDFIVVDRVGSSDQALASLADNRVDIILLDLDMPGTNGLEAIPALKERGRGAQIVIVSALGLDDSHTHARAMMRGAADTYPKPTVREMDAGYAARLRDRLRRIGHAARSAAELRATVPVACLALGASTGGVNALVELLRELPPSFDPPILVTQHLPPSFMKAFAAQLGDAGGRRSQIAKDRMPLARGSIYLAPGNAHLRVAGDAARAHIRLDRKRSASRCMPSLDPMLGSLGEVFGELGVGVVLSGMGRDGLAGAADLVAAGGTVMVQDKASSVVWGMPGAVAAADLASGILTPRQIAQRLLLRGAAA